ncbi:MAG: CPBP family intramembrane glutamic endopeptidase [Bacilli bacterium]
MNELYQPDLENPIIETKIKPAPSSKEELSVDRKTQIVVFVLGFLGLNLFASILVFFLQAFFKKVPGIIYPGYFSTFAFSGMVNGIIYFLLLVLMMIPLGSYFPEIKKAVLQKRPWLKGIVYSIIIIFLSGFYNVLLQLLGLTVSDNANQTAVVQIVSHSPFDSFIWIVLLGPIVEEFTYRLGLFGWLKKKNRILAYLGTMLIFGLIHFDFFNPDLVNELLNLPSYIIGGAILCVAYDKDGLGTSIAAHVYNNLLSFMMIFLGNLLI